jgi:predicted dehydrogenase
MAAGRKNRLYFEIYGDKKSISWDSENPNELWIGHRDGYNGLLTKDPSLMYSSARTFASFPGGHAEGFSDTSKQMFNQVYKHILNKDYENGSVAAFAVFEDGARELMLCEGILNSARNDRWVNFE